MREGVLFLDRQRVHVSAQANGARSLALAQGADNAGLRQPAVNFQPVGREFARDDVGGPRLVKGEFRMRVNVGRIAIKSGRKGISSSFMATSVAGQTR